MEAAAEQGSAGKKETKKARRAAAAAAKLEKQASIKLSRPVVTPTWYGQPFRFVTYLWLDRLFWLGWRRPLGYDDLPNLPGHCFTATTAPAFTSNWRARLDKCKETDKGRAQIKAAQSGEVAALLLRTVLRLHWRLLLGALALQLLYTGSQFAGPLILKEITLYLQTPRQLQGSPSRSFMWAGLLFIFPMFGSVMYVHSSRLAIISQIRIRAQLTALVYRKALQLSSRSRQSTEVGKIVNHMSVDVNEVMNFAYPFGLQLIAAPITLIVALVLLYLQIRWATFIGLAIMLAAAPASGLFVGKIIGLRRSMLKITDERVKLMNQLLAGIRVLKIYAWEAAQESVIIQARYKELGQLRKAIPYKVGMQTMLFAAPVLAAVASFAAYGSANPDGFTAARIFAAIALFSLMRMPLIFLPFALVQFGNALVSMRRLTGYLVMEERNDTVEPLGRVGASIQHGTFFWAEPPPKPEPKGKKGSKAQAKGQGSTPAAKGSTGEGRRLGRVARGYASLVKALGLERCLRPAALRAAKGQQAEGADTAQLDAEAAQLQKASGPLDKVSSGTASSDSVADAKAVAAGAAVEAPAPQAAAAGTAAGDASWWLREVNLEVQEGELVCVVGRVGSGKSSLIAALLGEMERQSGSIRMGGDVALVAQSAWIINASLRDNVLLGKELDEERWQACVHACCLDADLKVLPAGADTEIGEKGINVSGGQKQRISLARACYGGADFFILDDPLSAVDVHVGRHIFDNLISRSGMLGRKTRLLVTNQLQFVHNADRVVYIEAGSVAAQGSFEQVSQHAGFANMLAEFNSRAGEGDGDDSSSDREEDAAAYGQRTVEASPFSFAEQQEAALADAMATEVLGDINSSTAALARGGQAVNDIDPTQPMDGTHHREEDRQAMELSRAACSQLLSAGSSGRQGSLELAHLSSHHTQHALSPGGSRQRQSLDSAAHGLSSGRSSRRALPQHGRSSLEQAASRRSSQGRPHSSRQLSRKHSLAPAASEGGGPLGPAGKQEVIEKDGKVFIKAPDGSLIVAEDRVQGQVQGDVFRSYAAAYGWWALLFIVVIWAGEQTCRVLTNWWLSKWAGAETIDQYLRAAGIPVHSQRSTYLGGYVGFALGYVVLVFARSLSNQYGGYTASRTIYRQCLASLVRAPMTFFDTTPIGRILNRFSKDCDDMDQAVPQSITELGNCLMQIAATLIFIATQEPIFLAGMIPLMVAYYFLQMFYRRSYVELQRTDATTRSPVYAHFSESLTGVETIRAYGLQKQFAAKSDDQIDYNHRGYWTLKQADQWLSLRLDLIGSSLTLLVAMLVVAQRSHISAAISALLLSEILDVSGFLKYAVTSAAMFEARFNAVERLLAYRKLEPEAARHIPGKDADPAWPHAGALSYKDVWMKYRPELDNVLKGVSFDVKPGEKVGIVGRTGSGKSSLIVTLFRLVEAGRGRIELDGANLLDMGLEDVRSRIAAIPQEPVLFSGTVRSNLDPYSKHQDHELWEALSHVAMKDIIAAMQLGLMARVSENGDNFSTGQRQLLCVARALLRKPKVLVADEATASVDGETDAFLQRCLRMNFRESTVLIIAHRLNTVLDCNKVLVMDDGRVAEFDTPDALIAKDGGIFRGMVLEAGLTDEQASS